jgi:hypothetical protein
MSNLEILNEMALLDGEQPFVSSDFEHESVLIFESLSDAKSTFEFTNQIKNKLSIQVAEANIPADWTAMINDFTETESVSVSKVTEAPTVLSRLLSSISANRGVWGGGFATACLVLILIDPSGSPESTLGQGLAASNGTALQTVNSSSMRAASEKIGTKSSASNNAQYSLSELRELQERGCMSSALAEDAGKDGYRTDPDNCESESETDENSP